MRIVNNKIEILTTGLNIFFLVAPSALNATNSLFLINIASVITQPKTIDKGSASVSVKKPLYKR